MSNVKIKVFGLGGGGGNAVDKMIDMDIANVDFYVANTDMQALKKSKCTNKLCIGEKTTKGLGAGADPLIGSKAARETEMEIRKVLEDTDMVFLAAGLGGGTGTGAIPIVAGIAKEMGILTVAIVTKPFSFEGPKRRNQASQGFEKLMASADSVISISNNQLMRMIGRKPIKEAFMACDNVLTQGVCTITDLIQIPSLINLDFADVKTTLSNQGFAVLGIGQASGEDKANKAAEQAVIPSLLEKDISGARNAIVNVTGGMDMSLMDVEDAVATIKDAAGVDIDIIFGTAINPNLNDEIIVTVIATGFDDADTVLEKSKKKLDSVMGLAKKHILSENEEEMIPGFFRGHTAPIY
ncbi:cell division protein FtsZ [[Clostridium] innocuum]|nr:cell division protein FtsZ [[Clostridium] innocuum]